MNDILLLIIYWIASIIIAYVFALYMSYGEIYFKYKTIYLKDVIDNFNRNCQHKYIIFLPFINIGYTILVIIVAISVFIYLLFKKIRNKIKIINFICNYIQKITNKINNIKIK